MSLSSELDCRAHSTPKLVKEETLDTTKAEEDDTEPSSTVLKSLLGVSPVVPTIESPDSDTAEGSSKACGNNDSGFASMSKSPNQSSANSPLSRIRGILRSSLAKNSSLSLQQVIERVRGGKPSSASRARSFSLSDISELRADQSEYITITRKVQNSGVREDEKREREGTPESDEGYGTGGQSSSPDLHLAQLVRSMDTNRLPSISELDPASTPGDSFQSVPGQSANILNSLFSCGFAQHSALTLGHVGAPVLSDQQHLNSFVVTPGEPDSLDSLDRAAKLYRSAASVYEATCTWSGQLPPRQHQGQAYSSKVFLGGVPWDVTEKCLVQAFRTYGNIRIEWPGKGSSLSPPKGYLYVVFDSDHAVAALLSQCSHDYNSTGGSWYYRISR